MVEYIYLTRFKNLTEEQVKKAARKDNRDINGMINNAVEEYIKRINDK